jgi:hypothetical protein
MQQLKDLHKQQSEKVKTLDWQGQRRELKQLRDLSALALKTMGRVNDTFSQNNASIGSWINGYSLPLQLLTQPRLIVDVTPSELKKRRPFGMPFASLCQMAENDLVYLNFRDYDSDAKQNFREHSQSQVAERIEQLFERAKTQLYIGSALRKPIFDTALQSSGYDNDSYENYYNEAIENLSKAEQCFQEIRSVQHDAEFRTEKPSLVAVAWHWAYLNAISHYLPPYLIRIDSHKNEQNPKSELNDLFKKATELGEDAIAQPNENTKYNAAKAFVHLARRLRSCHLNFTAPLTGSWGTTYNMTGDEYKQAQDVRDYWREVPLQATDIEVNRYVLYLLQEASDNVHPSFTDIGLNNITLKEQVDDHVFTESVIESLINAIKNRENSINEAASILKEVKEIYVNNGISTDISRLHRLQNDYKAIESENKIVLIKALERLWNYVLEPAAGALSPALSQGIFPWIVPLFSDAVKASIKPLVKKLGHPPEGHRQIIRVRRILSGRR